MELKGNIQIEESGRDVDVNESGKQVTVTIAYKISGVDISEGLADPGADEEAMDKFVYETDDRIDDIVKQLRREVNDFFSVYGKKTDAFPDIIRNKEFIGVHADVNQPVVESLEQARSVEFDLEIHAFYELPVSSMEAVIERVKDQVLKSKS
jgi:hypothetical protein